MLVRANTCGATSSMTNASSSSIPLMTGPFAPNQRASAMAWRSSAEIAAATSARVGAATSGPRIDHHVLDERVVLEGVLAAVLAPAGLLDATVRSLGRQREVLIDPDGPELQLAGDAHRLADRAREHRAREPELHVVRPLHRLVLVGEALDGDDRPEDLVLDDLGALVGVRDDRRLEVGAGAVGAGAAEDELGLRLEGPVDHALHLVGLGLR